MKPVAPVETCINGDNLHRASFCTVKNFADKTTPSYTESNQPTHESPLVVIADNVEDLFQESIAASILTVMCNLQELIDNIGSKNCDGRYKTQVTGHRSGHRAQVTGNRSGHRAQGTGHWAQGTGQGTGHRSQVTGYRA